MNRYLIAAFASVVAAAISAGIVTSSSGAGKFQASQHRQVRRLAGLPTGDTNVYKLLINFPMDDGQTGQRTEWIARPSGSWRIEDETPKIYVGGQYYVVDTTMGSTVRSGTSIFMGDIPYYSMAAAALAAYTTGTMAQHGVTATQTSGGVQLQWPAGTATLSGTLQQTLAASSSQAQGLFSVPASTITASSSEVSVGAAPTNGTQGYWFGSTVSGRTAVLAVQRSSYTVAGYVTANDPTWADNVHFTYYELPADAGHTSATPGTLSAPDGEIQVASQARSTTNGQQTASALLNGVNGDLTYTPWPQQTITLASGEQATLVINKADGPSIGSDGQTRWTEFWVITGTTLVAVDGSFTQSEINTLAPQLRRL